MRVANWKDLLHSVCSELLPYIDVTTITSHTIVKLVSAGVTHGLEGLSEVAIPEAYGMAMALMWIWVARAPLTHMLKDNVPGVSSRHIDSLILLCMLAVTLAAYPASQGGGDFDWSKK